MNKLGEILRSLTSWKWDMPTMCSKLLYKMIGRLCTDGKILQAVIKQIRQHSRRGNSQTSPCQFGWSINTTTYMYLTAAHSTKEKHCLQQNKYFLCSPFVRVSRSRVCHWRNHQLQSFLLAILTSAISSLQLISGKRPFLFFLKRDSVAVWLSKWSTSMYSKQVFVTYPTFEVLPSSARGYAELRNKTSIKISLINLEKDLPWYLDYIWNFTDAKWSWVMPSMINWCAHSGGGWCSVLVNKAIVVFVQDTFSINVHFCFIFLYSHRQNYDFPLKFVGKRIYQHKVLFFVSQSICKVSHVRTTH